MMKRHPYMLFDEELELVCTALCKLNGTAALNAGTASAMDIFHRLTKTKRNRQEQEKLQAELDAKQAVSRALRAAKARLTKPQALSMAALRSGKPFGFVPYVYGGLSIGGHRGVQKTGWAYRRSMGGAINRMYDRLISEGLVDPGRRKLTPAGLERLTDYEARHGDLVTAEWKEPRT